MEFERNGLCKKCRLCCVYHSSVGGSIWPAIPVYVIFCESVSRVSIWVFLTFEFKFLIVMEFVEIAKSRGKTLRLRESVIYSAHYK